MKRLIRVLELIEYAAGVALLLTMFVSMILQIFFRYVLNSPFEWTEELVRYSFIWIVFIGSTFILSQDNHLTLGILTNKLPPRVQTGLSIVFRLLVMFFLVSAAIGGFAYVERIREVQSTALGIPVRFVYLSLPLMSVFMAVHSIYLLYLDITKLRERSV